MEVAVKIEPAAKLPESVLNEYWNGYDLTVEKNVRECLRIYVDFADQMERPMLVKLNLEKALKAVGWDKNRIFAFWTDVTGKYTREYIHNEFLANGRRELKTAFIL